MTADVSVSNARHYLRALELCGFVRLVQANKSGRAGSFARWHLVKDTGPKAPILRRDRLSLYDPNTQQTYGGTDAAAQQPA